MMDSVATGSTAEMRDPKIRASIGFSLSIGMAPNLAIQNVKNPMMKAEIRVPTTAYILIVQKFEKNCFFLKQYLHGTTAYAYVMSGLAYLFA